MTSIIGGAIALILLGLYAFGVFIVCRAPETKPNEPTETVLSSVGGLVSALIVSVLALTPTGISPTTTVLGILSGNNEASSTPASWIVSLYFGGWLLCGLALWITWMRLDTDVASSAFKSAAKAWLGLMIAAGFAYFGLQP